MTINRLRIRKDQVALEAFSSIDLVGLLKNTLPDMVQNFKEFSGFFAGNVNERPIVLTNQQQAFMKEVSKHSYMDIAPLAAFVPEGLQVRYTDYLEQLNPAVEHASQVMDKVLAPYSMFLSQLITNSDSPKSSRTIEAQNQALAKFRTLSNQTLGECFKKGSTIAQVSIGEVVARNNDWPKVFAASDAQVTSINKVDRKAVAKKMKECGDLLDIIMTKIRRGEFEQVSPEVVQDLADGAYQVAAELEYFVAIHYKVDSLAVAIGRTVEHFQSTMNK